MKAERWQQINDLFQSATERAPEERAAFLEEACCGDKGLCREVESLIASYERAENFIESPAFEVAPELLTNEKVGALVGESIAHYRIESLIGVGGMGEVYLARDERLGRNVALKLLPQALVADQVRLEGLKREARTASSLNHPNIVTIHEIGEVNGIRYIATEFVDGTTLRERMAQGPIPPNESVEIALQIANALSVAHGAGIVHCDIKPENIMLRPDGYVKVLDFGIAKFTQQENKSAGVEGTKRYMSPEQARGEELDARSDIWSLGVTLREMTAAPVPAELERVISRALSEERDARYASATELRADLQRVQRKLEAPARSRWRIAAALLGALVVAAVVFVKFFAPSPAALPHEKSIAVLPFEDLSGEKENAFFANGVHDEILTNLAKVADLKVISRTSVMGFRETKRNLPEIARALGVAHVVEGSVQRAAGRVRVSAQLIDARTDTHLWAERYDRELADVFAIQTEIAKTIAEQLHAKLSPAEKAAIERPPTADLAAYDLYLRAKEIWRRGPVHQPRETEEQVELLDQAVARDPAFVPALCLLARAHVTSYWFYHDRTERRLEVAKKALDAAARLQPDGGEVHLARAVFYYWGSRDYATALAELAQARRLLPNDPDILLFIGLIERRQGRWEESTRHIEEATVLDPRNANVFYHLANGNYIPLKRYADAARIIDGALSWQPNDFLLEVLRARVDMHARADLRRQKKLAASEAAKKSTDVEMVARTRLLLALAQRDYQAAQEVLSAYPLPEFRELDYVTPREFYDGLVARGLGDLDKARTFFQMARERAAAGVAQRPDDARTLIVLARIDAHLGRKDDAIREGEHAVELRPVAKDAFDGAINMARLAGVYAQVGESTRALDLLEQVAKLPNGPSYGSLKLDEVWDPLRGEPRFQKIVASLAAESATPEKRIAVLPFENLSADKSDAFFADGMHDEILTNLAKVADLKVISRTSVMGFRDTKRNLREIAETLGVGHIVEGSVQRAAGRVRVNAQLIDARTDTHLWAERYDRDVADVFAIQTEIAQQIVNQLRPKLSAAEKAAMEVRPTADLIAYALYTEATSIEFWRNWEGAEKSLNRKVELLEKATQRDPTFGLAYCALAKTQADLFSMTGDRKHLELAKQAAEAALRARPDLGEAHLELARYYFLAFLPAWVPSVDDRSHAGDFGRARDELTIAQRTLPNAADALVIGARIDKRENRWTASLANLQKAIELDPRNGDVAHHLMRTYLEMRRYQELEQFIAQLAATGVLQRPLTQNWLAEIKLAQGDPVAAQSLLEQVPLDFSPANQIWRTRFMAALYLRDYDAANRLIAATPAKWADSVFDGQPPESWADGQIALARGDKQKALAAFAAARKKVEATWRDKHKDEGYFHLVAKLDAGLGQKEDAIREGLRLVELRPMAKDSFVGPIYVANLALVYAWTGERDRAFEQLEIVAQIPAGPTYGDLRFNPCWDPLRGDPRFEKILASLAPKSAAPEKRIAVLPFENLNADKGDTFFADGMHDEILTNLAKVADLKVISRTSVMSFRDTKRNLREIAQALGVAHIVEGSVQRAAGRVRVSAQLIDARTDTHLWAERYDRELADVFAIQSEIAQKIAAQLKAALSPKEQEAINVRRTKDMLAYDFYLRAKEIERRVSGALPERLNEKVLLLDQAVARDAAFVPALCLLARAHLEIYWFNLDHTEARLDLASKALEAAARAQSDAGEVHLARAIRYYWGSRDYASALAELALARRSLPNDADTLQFLAFIERRQGQWDESIRHLEEARTIDPRNVATNGELAFEYVSLRRYTEAARVFEEVLVWKPDDFTIQLGRALVDVEAKADLRRLQNTIFGESARTGDAALIAAVRIRLPLWQRDYDAAEQALSAYSNPDIIERGYVTPREFFTGVIARGLADATTAQTAFIAARERAAAMVAERPDDAKALIILAEIDARLGRKAEAIREGEDANKLLPVSKDAFDGPDILARLAGVLAQVGEASRSLDLLEQVLKMPGAPSLTRPCYGRLQLDEMWDPLRGDPRFEKIVASLAPKERTAID